MALKLPCPSSVNSRFLSERPLHCSNHVRGVSPTMAIQEQVIKRVQAANFHLRPLTRNRWQHGARASSEAAPGPAGEGADERAAGDDELTARFMAHVNRIHAPWPSVERPSPSALMPPTAVVQMQMDALMRNDWPEEGSGVRAAFAFAMPPPVEEGDGALHPFRTAGALVRSWEAKERYVTEEEFDALLNAAPYRLMLNCDTWEMVSPMAFHGRGDARAVQAVRVTAAGDASGGRPQSRSSGRSTLGLEDSGPLQQHGVRTFTFTFCLEKVEQGAARGCWMVVGVRQGDYANV
eukprot:TRINITY_DN555_c0_g3_i1.p1 TRINITY_DN555_c0_g3~~TRINITY_DN555_c0_g3_i1.p1  ORF type:complete len:293 (-),score=44.42 TRINITY_DN555_c0_g3_i1:456-1334(-)